MAYQLKEIEKGLWMCTDLTNNIIVTWKQGDFNESQKVNELYDDLAKLPPVKVAGIVNDMTKWLLDNHSDLLYIDYRKFIASRVRELREQAGLTQSQLADKTGITRSNIARIEGFKYNMTIDTLGKIADALGCKIDFIRK